MAVDLRRREAPPPLLLLDNDPESSPEFIEALTGVGPLEVCADMASFLRAVEDRPGGIGLLDTATLADSPTALVGRLLDYRGTMPMGMVSNQSFEDYLPSIRRLGLLQVFVKRPPINIVEMGHFVDVVRHASNGFGLIRYLDKTIEMYSIGVRTMSDKLQAMERVINHFATNGYEVHELYDVRLILEELINNAFYHAYKTATGEEKYALGEFKSLAEGENVRIEYGSDEFHVGFSITDNAGTLSVATVLNKLERQANRQGLFDESGRGLWLSRQMASRFVINIERGKRTQFIALFHGKVPANRPRPFVINYLGPDTFDEWGAVDHELD